ncbi:MAG: CGLD27 family protein [Xenococcaceae cyanobacterium MO_188.B29]|nr:CGLD27 family protein [Xenococcaceae cyanobacterium MO_188.B29]
MTKFAFSLFPVPSEQLPVNEYQDLKESKFFRWAVLDRPKYAAKLLAVWISSLLVSLFIFTAQSLPYDIALSDFLWSGIVAKTIVLLCLCQLYLSWHEIYSLLIDKKIIYKFARNSRTMMWQKPPSMLMRDRLIGRFQVRPILKRIKQTIFLLLLLLGLNFSILFLNLIAKS